LHRSGRRVVDLDPFDPSELYGLDIEEGTYEQVRMRTPKTSSKSKTKHTSIEEQLDQVSSSLELLNDVLDGLGPGDQVIDNELIQTIMPAVERVHETIIRILQHESGKLDETLNARLFSANDAISEAMKKYERAKQGMLSNQKSVGGGGSGTGGTTTPAKRTPVAPPKPAPTKKEDHDFDEFAQLAQRKRPGEAADLFALNLSQPPPSTTTTAADPFAMTMSTTTPTNVNPFLTPMTAFTPSAAIPPLFPSAPSGSNSFVPPAYSFGSMEPLQPTTFSPNSTNTNTNTNTYPTPSKSLTPNIIQPLSSPQRPPDSLI